MQHCEPDQEPTCTQTYQKEVSNACQLYIVLRMCVLHQSQASQGILSQQWLHLAQEQSSPQIHSLEEALQFI